MQQIDIDFEVFKALTARRQAEEDTYNDVLRDLLGLDAADTTAASKSVKARGGRLLAGRHLPHGTKLRANYKQQQYEAEIIDGELIYNEKKYLSASAAAREITQTNVNGLTFWNVKRPSDFSWKRLVSLPKKEG